MHRVLVIALVTALAPAALLAQSPGARTLSDGHVLLAQGKSGDKGKGGGQGHDQGQGHPGHGQGGPQGGKDGSATFRNDHREIVNGYYQREYYGRGSCPPGLAKKNNGCLPPGQANKGYMVGQPWPHNLAFQPLPHQLLGQLGQPPSGYGYGYHGGDVIMYSQRDRTVVDIISTLAR